MMFLGNVLIGVLIKAARMVIDAIVKGETLNNEMMGTVRIGYAAAKEFYDNLVKDPEKSYIDEALDEFMALCEDTAEEGGWDVKIQY